MMGQNTIKILENSIMEDNSKKINLRCLLLFTRIYYGIGGGPNRIATSERNMVLYVIHRNIEYMLKRNMVS